ncbi:MAG: hypothetical protein KME05_14750 [Gloeocapsa sp. UFS-A4-WI-NPMV-4B04]|jgi:hypothetical protein|nr:hypothetical protein [Gloeocapsa sp. UFS-A4-WI-NPMV-4B04]
MKYGRYHNSKAEQEEVFSGLSRFFIALFWFIVIFNIAKLVYWSSNPPSEQSNMNVVDTCAEATIFLENALNARDAITPAEAMTSEGRAEWETLTDEGMEAEALKESLCGK